VSEYISECTRRVKESIKELEAAGLKVNHLEISVDVWAFIQMGGINQTPGFNNFYGLPVKRLQNKTDHIKAVDKTTLVNWTVYHNQPELPVPPEQEVIFTCHEFLGDDLTGHSFKDADFQNVLDWVVARTAAAGHDDYPEMFLRNENDPISTVCYFI
jgi:hypothetical protein